VVAIGVTEPAGAGAVVAPVGTTLGTVDGTVLGVVDGTVLGVVDGVVLGGGVVCMQVHVGLGLALGEPPEPGQPWWHVTEAEAAVLNTTVDPAARSGTLSAAVAIILRGRLDRKFIGLPLLFCLLIPVAFAPCGPAARQHGRWRSTE
jgi:hypothetical protein